MKQTKTGSKTINKDENVAIMKKHLKSLRKISGWTAQELGDLIGLSKQTINGLENNPDTNLSKAQYIAFYSLFKEKGEMDKNESLLAILNLLFGENEEYLSNIEKYDNNINMVAAAATTVGKGAAMGVALAPLAGLFFPAGVVGSVIAGSVLAGGAIATGIGSAISLLIKKSK